MAKRIFILIAAALLLGAAAPLASAAAAAANPLRVMSLNLCTDQLLLVLLPRERITSVSFLSLSSQNAYLTAESAHVPVNYGSLEEVFAQRPDLVIAGTATTPTARALLERSRITLLEVPPAETFAQIRSVTRLVAGAVGEEGKGESLIQHMDATLAELASKPLGRRIVVAGWESAGEIPARGTLFDAILSAAGAVNLGAIMGNRVGVYDLEQLLLAKPDVLAFADSAAARPGLRSEQLHHPILDRLYSGRQISYPETLLACGLPQSADAAKALRDALVKATAGPRP
ncbi:MAG TPA: ABC transporter substrate-binding protein [Micropepsaceae bacterium]|nr:ABC transporter substrate-binding protein [Micropepsaceae bacterium]